MSFFKKDPPAGKPSFANVQKGSSTTAQSPAAVDPASSPRTGAPGADFSNVQSGSSSTAPSREPVERTVYVVRSGDSLSRIAQRHYGEAKQWTRIYEANRDLIGNDPNLIQPGQSLVLPKA